MLAFAECYKETVMTAVENTYNPASIQSRMEIRWRADSGPILHAYWVRCFIPPLPTLARNISYTEAGGTK